MAHNDPLPVSASGSGPSTTNSGFHVPNTPPGGTTFTKLFVGGLAWETQDESLRRHFEQHGQVVEAVVITDKSTGRSKGYGFVTFVDPESARKACEDPTPVIDGRRANCNLASLGRHQANPSFGHLGSIGTYFDGVPVPRGTFSGNLAYYQPVLYDYQQGFAYPSYGYTMYNRTDYMNPQNVYDIFGAQFVQARGIPGAMNPSIYSFRQISQPLPASYEYPTFPAYEMPMHQFLQFRGPYLNGATFGPISAIQAPNSPGVAVQVPPRPQSITVPVYPPCFTHDSISDQVEG